MTDSNWMIYGANGYTGNLLVQEALNKGLKPIVAGRTNSSIKMIAEKYNLPYRVFSLNSHKNIVSNLEGIKVAILAAGPFSETSKPFIDACILTKTHYLDITGEIDVFESCSARSREAAAAGIMLLPGTGFDIVPSDCLSATLHEAMPDAKYLTLAISAIGTPSPGTMKTVFENLHKGGMIRHNGKLIKVPAAWKITQIPFKKGKKWAMTFPAADISSSYVSTGIQNIAAYLSLPENMIRMANFSKPLASLLKFDPLQKIGKFWIEKAYKGATEEERKKGKSFIWGRVENKSGQSIEGNLETIEGYDFTAKAGIDILSKVLEGKVILGYTTPSKLLGASYVLNIEGTKIELGEIIQD